MPNVLVLARSKVPLFKYVYTHEALYVRACIAQFFCYGPCGRMNTWLVLSKLMGIARRGVLKELEVCDFDKNLVTCQ